MSFNYTDLYKPYLPLKYDEIFHIHGKLSNNDLPIIGYYYSHLNPKSNTTDYIEKYRGSTFHKPALCMKQNNISFESRFYQFQSHWENKISEIVVIGYSFGESDSHIYSLLNKIMISQISNVNVPSASANKIPIVNFKIFNYNDKETIKLIEKIKVEFSKINRKNSVNVTGVGFTPEVKDIITFQEKIY